MMNHKQYYRKLLLERIKAQLMATIFLLIIILSPLWLIYITITEEGIVDRLNKCYKAHSYNYCQNNIK